MVMVSDPGTVQIPRSGTNVGRVEEWSGHPGTWDGWADIPGAPTEELVCNGGSRDWCRYMVTRRYLDHLLDELGGATYWSADRDGEFTEKSRMVSHCLVFMSELLAAHYQEIRRDRMRVRREVQQG
ncbi:hypothetical protein SEA_FRANKENWEENIE_300 [Streptomyces phage Frankenweenie]|nr:hypothetical protein SEA_FRANKENWEENIE_300 [Streptomyces phage Frankenweenie]